MNMRVIGSYRVLRPLGAGGMGEVLLGYDERLERPVALKRVRGAGSERHRRLRREAQMVARLSHANIVQVHDLVDTDDGVVVVMEFVEGRTIAEELRDGPFEIERAIDLGRQIARGLDAAHAAGLVHRDLKPANVMVSADGTAKVLDFGIAKSLSGDSMTATGAVLGTYRSMSPEQALGQTVDGRSDLFALGALLYEMLTGVSPFAATTPFDTLQKVTEGTPTPAGDLRPDAPAALLALINASMAKDPAARPPSAGHVARVLDGLLADTSTSAPPVPTPFGDFATTVDNARPMNVAARSTQGSSSAHAPPMTHTPGPARSAPGARRTAAITAIAAVIIAIVVLGSLWQARARPTLRVLLLPPIVESAGDTGSTGDTGSNSLREDSIVRAGAADAGFVRAGYIAAGVRALTHLDGIRVVDPAEARGLEGTPTELARAVAADETVQASLRIAAATAFVTLSRATADGTIHWTNTFQVPTAPEDALVLAAAVTTEINRAFDDHARQNAPLTLGASSTDYAAFLRIKESLETGVLTTLEGIDQLESLIRSSPRFTDAYAALASAYLSDFFNRDHLPSLTNGTERLTTAQELAPTNPSLLEIEIRLALARGDTSGSQAAAERFEQQFPGDPLVQTIQAQLAERGGDLEQALTLRREAAHRMPSWRNLWWLANVARRTGDISGSRQALETLLARAPDNFWGLMELGQLELLNGDLEQASQLFRKLIRERPRRSLFTNLGLAEFLSGNYAAAAESFRQALRISPGHLTAMLNLADAYSALDEDERAEELYRQVLQLLDAKAEEIPLSPGELTKRGQALARLGQHEAAIESTLQALQANSTDGEIAFQASLVYALVGEEASAFAAGRQARRLGIQPRWFTFPAFQTLRTDARFASLMTTK